MAEDLTLDPMQLAMRDIADLMRADPWFANVPIFDNIKGDIVETVKSKLAAKLGLCVSVEIITDGTVDYGVGSHAINAQAHVTIVEQPLFNRAPGGTGKTAFMVLVRAICLFNPNSTPKPCLLTKFRHAESDDQIVMNLYGPISFSITPN